LIRDCLPIALLILAYRIECFLFCGLFGTAFLYTKWLPFNLKVLIFNFPVKSADPERAPTRSHPVSAAPIRTLRSLRCRASTAVAAEADSVFVHYSLLPPADFVLCLRWNALCSGSGARWARPRPWLGGALRGESIGGIESTLACPRSERRVDWWYR
jgi:hypothetical protein